MPAPGFKKATYVGLPKWHQPVVYVEPDERRERYEGRLALEWCRENGNPHLTDPSSRAYGARPNP